jgi:hypothetical protein
VRLRSHVQVGTDLDHLSRQQISGGAVVTIWVPELQPLADA